MEITALPLIVTNTDDVHADALIAELARRSCPHFRLNTNVMGHHGTIAWTLHDCEFIESGRLLNASNVTSVIWRRPEPAQFSSLQNLSQLSASAIEEDALLAVEAALRAALIQPSLWVSHPDNIRRANFKPRQLRDALALGFDVPDTLITNDPARAKEFLVRHDYRVAAKQPARGRKIPTFGSAVYSVNLSRHSRDYINSLLETVRFCPVMFQEYVEKSYEVRTTFFGTKSFSAKIFSQEHDTSRDDWRRAHSEAEVDLRHESGELPNSVLDKCKTMLARYGLNFGCFDFIVTPDSKIVFLELNPNGQFLWLEVEEPHFPMAKAWADLVTGVLPPISM